MVRHQAVGPQTEATKVAAVRRVDKILAEGSAQRTEFAFEFVRKVDGNRYPSPTAPQYKLAPLIEERKKKLDQWEIENCCVKQLQSPKRV
jgi:hypothetical protein